MVVLLHRMVFSLPAFVEKYTYYATVKLILNGLIDEYMSANLKLYLEQLKSYVMNQERSNTKWNKLRVWRKQIILFFLSCSVAVWPYAHQWLLFLIWIHSMQGWTATTRHEVTRKKHIKVKNKGNLFRKNLQLKDVC